LWTVTKKFK